MRMYRNSMAPMRNIVPLRNFSFLVVHFIFISVAEASPRSSFITANQRYLRGSGTVLNVEQFGAVGNGENDATKAFAQAWGAACKASSATLLVPHSKTFVVNNLAFEGPCEPGFVFQVDGTIVAPKEPESWQSNKVWLLFEHLQQFTLSGSGTIDGQGQKWWENKCRTNNENAHCNDDDRPTAVHFNDCKGIVMKGLHAINSPIYHLTLSNCDNVQIVGVQIRAPEESPNTDGIDIFASKNILIQDVTIGTGDDCVAIGDGSSDITIKGITCGPGHGISIGSLGKENSAAFVRSVHVDGAKLIATDNGLRIKTWQGGSGTASDISYENVEMENVSNPIIIDQFYCDSPTPCRNQSSAVQISNVTYKNIRGTSATPAAIKLECSQSRPCKGISLSEVSLTTESGSEVSYICEHAEVQTSGRVRPLSCNRY